MAKKKNVEAEEEEEEELSELEDDSFEDLDDESIFPDIEKKPIEKKIERVINFMKKEMILPCVPDGM